MDTLFHALVENSSDAIVTLDATGAVLFASESSVRLLGFTLEEPTGSFVVLELGWEAFECNVAGIAAVPGEPNPRHATSAQLAVDRESSDAGRKGIGHGHVCVYRVQQSPGRDDLTT